MLEIQKSLKLKNTGFMAVGVGLAVAARSKCTHWWSWHGHIIPYTTYDMQGVHAMYKAHDHKFLDTSVMKGFADIF